MHQLRRDQRLLVDRAAEVAGDVDYGRAFTKLCHLVALNRTDTLEGAVDSVILTTLVVAPAEDIRGPRALVAAIPVLFGAQLEEERVRDAIDRTSLQGRR